MGRRVKLWDAPGEYGDSDTAYKVEKKYYTSKEAYESYQNDNLNRQKVIILIHSLLGYEEHQMIPTIFLKKLKEWKPYGYDVVLQTLEDNASSVEWALQNKNFDSEIRKVQYISSIIANHLVDTEKKMKREKRSIGLMSNVVIIDDFVDLNNTQKTKDISRFLEDED